MSEVFRRTTRTPKTPCPHCGYEVDSHPVPFSLDSPSSGDLSVCIHRGGLLKFGKNLMLQPLEQDEIFQVILDDPKAYATLMKMREAVLHVKNKRFDRKN